jgi:hypothetical protein
MHSESSTKVACKAACGSNKSPWGRGNICDRVALKQPQVHMVQGAAGVLMLLKEHPVCNAWEKITQLHHMLRLQPKVQIRMQGACCCSCCCFV